MMRARRHDERGFTLLEMIIVLVLIGVASAVIFPAVSSMMRSSTRSAALSGATGDGRIAERIVEHDVRGAAGARSKGNRSDLAVPGASVIQALNAPAAASHDIVRATPTALVVNTEAMTTSAGPETVTLQLEQNRAICGEMGRDGRNWCLVRTVQGAFGTVSEVLTRGRSAFPATIPNSPCGSGSRLFCYRLSENPGGANAYRWNGGWRPSLCRTRWTDINSTLGGSGWINNVQHNGFDPAVRIHQLDLITEVSVTLPTGGGFGATAERSFTTTELAIRSRQGEAYQQAIMCGAR
jgi:prepilin-type N-terminal cleavage/methylation domain-containing protein